MQGQIEVNSSILERFEFRDIRQEEADQAVLIEKICFPPNEACSETVSYTHLTLPTKRIV